MTALVSFSQAKTPVDRFVKLALRAKNGNGSRLVQSPTSKPSLSRKEAFLRLLQGLSPKDAKTVFGHARIAWSAIPIDKLTSCEDWDALRILMSKYDQNEISLLTKEYVEQIDEILENPLLLPKYGQKLTILDGLGKNADAAKGATQLIRLLEHDQYDNLKEVACICVACGHFQSQLSKDQVAFLTDKIIVCLIKIGDDTSLDYSERQFILKRLSCAIERICPKLESFSIVEYFDELDFDVRDQLVLNLCKKINREELVKLVPNYTNFRRSRPSPTNIVCIVE